MNRHAGEYRTEIRHEMRGGKGDVKIEHLWEPGSEMKAPCRMVARLTLEPGCSIGFHRHETEEETFVIVRGEAEADDNGSVIHLKAGDTMLTGNGAGHAIANTGSGILEIIAIINKYC